MSGPPQQPALNDAPDDDSAVVDAGGRDNTRGGELPEDYGQLLEQLKTRVRTAQVRAARAANTELLRLYWSIGRDILERQQHGGWGAKIIDRLAYDLRAAFSDQRGFSRANLHSMRAVAAAWPDEDDFVQQAVGQLPWGHVTVLLARTKDPSLRDWYAAAALHYGWSRNVLEHHLATDLHRREGEAISNFAAQLLTPDSDLAQQLTRDPYVFEHLALTKPKAERELEQSLMDRLQETLTEFGHGMAFVGRQVHFNVDDTEMVIDLLLFAIEQCRYVVVELKIGTFSPAYTGQLGAYVALVDDRLRRPERHAPTVGILLCTKAPKHQSVQYALASTAAPVAVASYTYDRLPADERAALPDADTLTAALTQSTSRPDDQA